jgi:hypothetical protein
MPAIQGSQMAHLIQSIRLLTSRLLAGAANSCSAPAGQAQPHHSSPTKRDETNIAANTMKLALTTPSAADCMIRTGEK